MAAIVIKNVRAKENEESQKNIIFQEELIAQAMEIRIRTSPIRLVSAVIIPAARDLGF